VGECHAASDDGQKPRYRVDNARAENQKVWPSHLVPLAKTATLTDLWQCSTFLLNVSALPDARSGFQDRVLGHPNPVAVAVAIWLRAVADAVIGTPATV
jgi:hypothetical protein